jgi:nucleotide-binding universal stress UspA family protein
MYRDVLVPLDGSTFSERALSCALPIARLSAGTIRLLLVHEPIARYAVEIAPTRLIDRWEDRQRDREARYVEQRAMALRSAEVTVVAELQEGDAADEIARRAGAGVDLLVMSTHGRGGVDRIWAGSVADDVMRHVRLPLILVPPTGSDPSPPSVGSGAPVEIAPTHIVAATDGSPAAAGAVEHAARLARLFNARLTVVRAVTPPKAPGSPYVPHTASLNQEVMERREAAAREFLEGVTATIDLPVSGRVVRASHAARGILAVSKDLGADLVAVGTHRRSRFARAALGSVADEVVRASTVPVLVAHLAAEPQPQSDRTSPS